MKHIAILLVCALAYSLGTWAQGPIPHSQTGFDVENGLSKIATPLRDIRLSLPHVISDDKREKL